MFLNESGSDELLIPILTSLKPITFCSKSHCGLIGKSQIKAALHEIWMAETKKDANKAFDNAIERFEEKYAKAMSCLKKDRAEMLAFYDFPAEHWVHIRTSNPIESAFATVRLRSRKSRNCGSRETTLTMVFKLLESS
jgi:transposase-like protein